MAVDNGPLKAGAASHPLIRHLTADAFTFELSRGRKVDWLFCDLVENPYRVLDLVRVWLENRACRRFIVNLKVGQCDPIAVLRRIRDPDTGLAPWSSALVVRQLHHDREEITAMGDVRA
jgi:23S rRNA (cytidine2498-2'-O)-methyltransferase